MAFGEDQQLVVFSLSRRRRRTSRTSTSWGYEQQQKQLVVLAADATISFLMLWAAGLVKLLVSDVLGWDERPEGVALKAALNLGNTLAFAWIGQDINGGNLSPISVLSDSAFDGNAGILFALFGRIPAQVIGALTGVRLIKAAFPSIGSGPQLNVGIHHGALTEGLLTFMAVIVSLALKKRDPTSFFMRTCISNISKMTFHSFGSDLTGGIMNPASAFGWAYARGDHTTMEHLLVYWFAPLQATLLGVWTFKLITEPSIMTDKSD